MAGMAPASAGGEVTSASGSPIGLYTAMEARRHMLALYPKARRREANTLRARRRNQRPIRLSSPTGSASER